MSDSNGLDESPDARTPDRGSGGWKNPTVNETLTITDQAVDPVIHAVEKVSLATKAQWAIIGVMGTATTGFIVWALATLGNIGQAQAQTGAQAAETRRVQVEHLAKDAAEKIVIFQMFEEQRKDTKALYQALMTRQVQPRLEPDGGVGP